MLTGRREQIVFMLCLVVANAGLGWHLERLWREDRGRTRWIYAAAAPEAPAVADADSAQPRTPQNFGDIADRNLFSPQRANQPPQAAQEVKTPELPLLYGSMNLGNGWFALMAPGGESSPAPKRVVPGDEIGGYKLVSIAVSQVVLTWQGKQVTVDVSESARRIPRIVERAATPEAGSGRPQPGPAPAAAARGSVISVAGSAGKEHIDEPWSPPGATEDTPEGTVINGRRKVVVDTPFGKEIEWQLVNPSESQTPNPNQPQNRQP